MTQLRAMLHLVPADPAAALAEAVVEAARRPHVTGLIRSSDCFVGSASPHAATIETVGERSDPATLLGRCRDAIEALGDTVDRGASMAVIGVDIAFIGPPAAPTPVRFQYLMRRRNDFTHEAYLHRYREVHSQFGLRTPHIDGYVQLHVDPVLSAELATATGLADVACDSVSELHLRSVRYFLEGIIAHPEVGQEAQEDEERFVDRARSFGFCNTVLQS